MAAQTKCGARRRRSLVALAVVAAVLAGSTNAANNNMCASSTCIANGERECDRETADCPPCMYLLSTGSFSCYDLVDGACPYGGTYTICDSSSASSSGSTPSTTTLAPSATTTDPSSTTATPSSTTATPSATAASGSNTSDNSVAGTVAPIVKTTATTASGSGSKADSLPSSSSSSSSTGSKATFTDDASSSMPTPSSSPAASSSGSSGSAASSATASSSGKKSSDVVMMAVLIGAAAVGIVVVAVFIAHRVRRRRMLEREPYRSTFGADGTMFAVPAGAAKSSGIQFASRSYSSHLTPTTSNSITVLGGGPENRDGSIVMLADSQTRGASQPSAAGVTLLSMSSLSSSTADFALGPQFRPDESGVVDLTASTASTSSLKTHPASPLTLDASLTRKPVAGPAARAARSNFVPHAIVEGREEEEEFSSFEQQSRYVRLASAESIIYTKADFAPASSDVSISSSMSSLSDEYDIVDPHTIRDGERRNTELLVRDSEFPKFSAFSESDLLSEDGAGDDDDDLSLAKEREI